MNVVLCTHEPLSPAVQRCCDARNRMIERDRNMPEEETPQLPKDVATNPKALLMYQAETMIFLDALDPNLAYRTVMPEPIGRRNIKNFIACVVHGMAIQAITPEEGKNLLYAARTATLAIGRYKDRETKKPVAAATHPKAVLTEYERYQLENEKWRANRTSASI
jgi:hypothetical protein